VIKDVPKTLVYELVRYRNEHGDRPVVPPTMTGRLASSGWSLISTLA